MTISCAIIPQQIHSFKDRLYSFSEHFFNFQGRVYTYHHSDEPGRPLVLSHTPILQSKIQLGSLIARIIACFTLVFPLILYALRCLSRAQGECKALMPYVKHIQNIYASCPSICPFPKPSEPQLALSAHTIALALILRQSIDDTQVMLKTPLAASNLSRAQKRNALTYLYRNLNVSNRNVFNLVIGTLQADSSDHLAIGEGVLEDLAADESLTTEALDSWFIHQTPQKSSLNKVTASSYLLPLIYKRPEAFNLDAQKMAYFTDEVEPKHHVDGLTADNVQTALQLLETQQVIQAQNREAFCRQLIAACQEEQARAIPSVYDRLQLLIDKLEKMNPQG